MVGRPLELPTDHQGRRVDRPPGIPDGVRTLDQHEGAHLRAAGGDRNGHLHAEPVAEEGDACGADLVEKVEQGIRATVNGIELEVHHRSPAGEQRQQESGDRDVAVVHEHNGVPLDHGATATECAGTGV